MFSASARAQRGFTLTEVMIASVILGILVLAVMPVIRLSQQGFSAMETRNSLKSEGQSAMNKIGQRLVECKRMFENTADDNAFLAKAILPIAAMPGSALPSMEELGTISPSTTSFVSASVGNRLFFASVLAPADVTVVDGGGVNRNVRVDLYMFNIYYLALDATATKSIGGRTRRVLKEWHSAPYADYSQISSITDVTKRANTAKAMAARGVGAAWNPSVSVATAAFYSINAGSGAMTLNAAHTIAAASTADMIKIISGLSLGGFRHGVAPNTAGLSVANPVPQFGAASGNFPSGFEVVIVGPNSARQVFLRLVLAAEGTFPGVITSEQVLLTTARDLY